MIIRLAFALFAGLTLLLPVIASAHDARPLAVTILEQTSNVYRVVVKAPPTLEAQNTPVLIYPSNCEIRESVSLGSAMVNTSILACANSLQGQTLHLQYPDFNPSLTTIFRLETLSGISSTLVLSPDKLSWIVPEASSWKTVAKEYTILGFQHIWGGIDHLLFVAGLLLLARVPRKIILAVTGFTLAHSITLALAVYEVVRVPIALVEAMIALSILFLAAEIARHDKNSFSQRFPVALSFVFGLLHGFGFANALGEISLPTNEVITGLLFFNIGVEFGQLSFIAVLLAVVWICYKGKYLISHTPATAGEKLFNLQRVQVGAYILGIPAAFWFIERSLIALSA